MNTEKNPQNAQGNDTNRLLVAGVPLRVLVACEYSGTVREAINAMGHDAMSCDLLDTEIPGKHYKGDVNDIIGDDWDLVIAHPPCTYLSNSGVRWLYNKDGSINESRWRKMEEAALFFKRFLDLPGKVAIENPIMHKHALAIIGVKPTQIVQPWQFGHGETKATCLWLKNLPKLEPTNIVEGREQRIWKLPPSADRWKERSRTFKGIAEAIATQWTSHTCN